VVNLDVAESVTVDPSNNGDVVIRMPDDREVRVSLGVNSAQAQYRLITMVNALNPFDLDVPPAE
jgi:hypothetical protein